MSPATLVISFVLASSAFACHGSDAPRTSIAGDGDGTRRSRIHGRLDTLARLLLTVNPAASWQVIGSSHVPSVIAQRPAGACLGSRCSILIGQSTGSPDEERLPDDYTLISTSLLSQLLEVDQAPSKIEQLPLSLRNRYFALRHGQSESNVEGVISSNPDVGTVRHGLTSEGRLQARRAATRLVDLVGRDNLDRLMFVSSDFTRAHQTAEEARLAVKSIVEYEMQACLADPARPDAECELLATPTAEGVEQTPLLRERWFGELDGTVLRNYNQVWPRDLVSAEHSHKGVEPVEDVVERIRKLVLELELDYEGRSIVLTSHADTLQIAQCFIAGADPRGFSMYRFKNGEVRELLRTPKSLPEPVPLTYA